MINQDVIEEHPINQPATWVSNAVIAPKIDHSIRMSLDACNVNKAILPSNRPIPRHEDIKAKLAGFTFWQIELYESSRYLTVFHTNDKLCCYKRLTMGSKPAQGELNVALKPLFMPIENAHLTHDDLIPATTTVSEHIQTIRTVMEVVSEAGLTLNPEKCNFINKEINF